jgi:hypothetical protein
MKYYSNKIFWSLIIFSVIAEGWLFFCMLLGGLAAFTSGPKTELEQISGLIHPLILPLIILIICLQQYKGYKRLGYLMIVPIFYYLYFYYMSTPFEIFQESFLIICNVFRDPISALWEFIFLLPVFASLIPVYVLAKTGYEDLLKRGKSKK